MNIEHLSIPERMVGEVKYVGFDMDGTLIDTMGSIPEVFGTSIQEDFGISMEYGKQFFLKTLGTPTHIQIQMILKTNGFELLSENDALTLGQSIDRRIAEAPGIVFPEVTDALDELKNNGLQLFISSSHTKNAIEKKLKVNDLHKYFGLILGSNPARPDFTKGKSHFLAAAEHFNVSYPEFAGSTVFIGDSLNDISSASNARIMAIGRAGTFNNIELHRAGAIVVINDFSQLPLLLRSF